MQILKALSLTIALLVPVAAIAAPAVRAHAKESCCPGCPLCHHAEAPR